MCIFVSLGWLTKSFLVYFTLEKRLLGTAAFVSRCLGVLWQTSLIMKDNSFLQIYSHIFCTPNSICWQRNMLSLSSHRGKQNKYFPTTCGVRTPPASVSNSSRGMAFLWLSFPSPMTSSSLFGSFSSTMKHPQVSPVLKRHSHYSVQKRSFVLLLTTRFNYIHLYFFTACVFLSPRSLALSPSRRLGLILAKITS